MENKNVLLNCAAAWLIPGAGHLLLRRPLPAGVLFAGCAALIAIGLWSGGLYYPGSPADFGMMFWLHELAGAGNAIFLLLNFLFKQGIESKTAVAAFGSAAFEYAGRCLALAGLINFLAILHVYDLSRTRPVSIK